MSEVTLWRGEELMRDTIQWLVVFLVLSLLASVYWRNRATTYRTADGGCQSLTVEDECY